MSVIKSLVLMTLISILQNIDAQDSVQIIDHPHKNEYILQQHGSDKHKYGYELKENKHFHHTTTEEDGVRLGCYGYALNGKKYSTQYVADVKGYRPVYTYDVINVYPRSGGTREASFIGNFDEDQKKSANIRYFFPEGCRGDDMIQIPPERNPMPPPIKPITPRPVINQPPVPQPPKAPQPPPKVYTPKPSQPTQPYKPQPPVKQPPPPPSKRPNPTPAPPPKAPITYLPPVNYLPPVTTPRPVIGNYITRPVPARVIPNVTPSQVRPPAPVAPPRPVAPPSTPNKPFVVPPQKPPTNSCNAKSCCSDESLPKLVIPINLDSQGKAGACGRFASLIVPADSVGMDALKNLLSNPTELAKKIIKSLS